MISLYELQTLYRVLINLNKDNDVDFGFEGKSRVQKVREKFGSEKEFLKKHGELKK